MIGIGAMLHHLSGGSPVKEADLLGQVVTDAAFDEANDRFRLQIAGRDFHIWDDGQSCCEHRYMKCDDDPQSIVGGTLLGIEPKDAPDVTGGDEYDEEHEQVFIEIRTTKGLVTLNNHNEHNGYYGGFGLTITPA